MENRGEMEFLTTPDRAFTPFTLATPDRVVGPGLAGASGTAGVRLPRLDPFHVILAAVDSCFKRNPELELSQ